MNEIKSHKSSCVTSAMCVFVVLGYNRKDQQKVELKNHSSRLHQPLQHKILDKQPKIRDVVTFIHKNNLITCIYSQTRRLYCVE